jgi:hypothetical protein
MTTPAKPSNTACVLRRLRFNARLLVAGLALTVLLAGCDFFHDEFDVAVGNRTANRVFDLCERWKNRRSRFEFDRKLQSKREPDPTDDS